jgi:hypothetical protein
MKIRPVVTVFHADGRTDMTQLIAAFRNFANTPKNWKKHCNVDRRVNAKNATGADEVIKLRAQIIDKYSIPFM